MSRSHDTALLDREYLQENFHDTGFGYLLPELLELFTQQTHTYLTALHTLYLKDDLQSLAIEAHGLKGTAGSVGAIALAATAAALEQAVIDRNHSLVSSLMKEVQQLGPETLEAVTAERRRLAVDDESLNFLDP